MAAEHLVKLTSEELRVLAEKGRQARAAKVAIWEAEKHLLKLEYLDSGYWQVLASRHGVRMPSQIEPASVRGIRKFLKKAGVSNEEWVESYGTVRDWIGRNPAITLYAAVGQLLELK